MCCQDRCNGYKGRCCVVVLVAVVAVFFGISTLGAGIIVLLVHKYDRSHRLGKVEDAVVRWNNPSSPATSWQQFEKLNVYAKFTPGVFAKNRYTECANYPPTVKLSSSDCPPNVYHEEAARFASVKQLAFCASVNYSDYQTCDLQVELLVMQPGAASGNTTLLSTVSAIVGQQAVSIGMYDLEGDPQCSGKRRCSSDCKNKCSKNYGGFLSCSDLKCRTNAYVDNLAVKVAYMPDTSRFYTDYFIPDMGPASKGANALPKGYTWTGKSFLNNITLISESGPTWELERLAFVLQPPEKLTLTVRCSSDPWLVYMAATRGSGYFGINMGAVLGISIALIAVGSILLLAVMIFAGIHTYGTVLYSRDSTRQPDGCFRAISWRLAARLHSPPQPAATSPASQIVMGHPVAADGTTTALAAPAPPVMYYTPMSYTVPTAPPGSSVYPPPPPAQYASVTYPYPAGAPTASAGSTYYPPPPPTAAGSGTATYSYP